VRWQFAWHRARAIAYWNSPAYEDDIFAPQSSGTSHPLTKSTRVLDPLEVIAAREPGRYIATCPAHADGSASLRVTVLDDGKVLLYCFAGCETVKVMDSLWLGWSDLWA
jgi:hypothetical protein